MTIAELLGDPTVKALRNVAASGPGAARAERNRQAMLVMAAGKPGSPFTRDAAGRLRRNGRFVAVK